MRYRALSPTGDFSFGKGGQDYLTGTEAIAQAIRTRLLLLLGEWWEDQEDGLPLFQRILGSRGDDRGRQAVDRIQKHFTEDISITELIAQTHLSKTHFHKLFREYTGRTPNGLITELRLELAKHLLTTSQEKICDIAAMCGYYDHVYFNYLFKKQTGLSPGSYRKIYYRPE